MMLHAREQYKRRRIFPLQMKLDIQLTHALLYHLQYYISLGKNAFHTASYNHHVHDIIPKGVISITLIKTNTKNKRSDAGYFRYK